MFIYVQFFPYSFKFKLCMGHLDSLLKYNFIKLKTEEFIFKVILNNYSIPYTII